MFKSKFKDTPVWCFKDQELKDILGYELYGELIQSGDIDKPKIYNFGYNLMHISYYFTDKAKQIIKDNFLVN